MNVKAIYPGEYANYIFNNEGDVHTHDNNKLIKYAIPEKVTTGAAGHPYGYAIGESGALYMLTGDNTTVKKIADRVKHVGAYWEWAVVVFGDNSTGVFKNGIQFSTIDTIKTLAKIDQIRVAHYITVLTEDGTVHQLDWSKAQWKAGLTWNKSAAEMQALKPRKIELPGKATWVTTSRNMFSTAIVDGRVYVWCDSTGAKYFGWKGQVEPTLLPTEELMTSIEASDHTLHMIGVSGALYGMGGLGVGFVGNGKKEPEVEATGGWPDMVVKTFVTTPVKLNDRKYKWIAFASSYKFRNIFIETDGTVNTNGYGKFGLPLNGIRPQDDPSFVGAISIPEPRRILIPDVLMPKSTAELKVMIANKTYPPPEPKVIDPPPMRKVVAILYDDGKWEKG